jgi:carboxylesterase
MGEWLAARGLSIVGPRLPGHGTRWEDCENVSWQEWEREAESALFELAARCSTVIAVGLSMGASVALHLGVKHPETVNGVVAINPFVRRPDLVLAPLLRLFVRSTKGVGNDIKKPGQSELPYERVPLRAAAEAGRFIRRVDRELPSLRVPLLVFSSVEDHLVKPANSARVMRRAGSAQKELIRLTNSYHVAPLDYDAELIFERVNSFARSLAGAGTPSAP